MSKPEDLNDVESTDFERHALLSALLNAGGRRGLLMARAFTKTQDIPGPFRARALKGKR
jgi:hypothetical protein